MVIESAGIAQLPTAGQARPALASGFARRYARNPLVVAATLMVALFAIAGTIGPMLLDPFAFSQAIYSPPSLAHPFGTDNIGRDVFSQVVWGARSALILGLGAALLAAVVGTAIGAIAGYFGGVIDAVLMRVTDIMLSLPTFFILLLFGLLFGSGLLSMSIVIGLTIWTGTARVIRAEVLTQRQRRYVEAARAAGASHAHVLVREVLPNSVHPAIALVSLSAAWAILAEAGLSFLGLRDSSQVTWGWMLQIALEHFQLAWWMAVFPGIALSLLVFSFNLVGDGINDARNPRIREGRGRRSALSAAADLLSPPAVAAADIPVLDIQHLTIGFPIGERLARVVDDISFTVRKGEMVGLVGESGSGKTMTALAVVGLVPPPGYVVGGAIRAAGVDVVSASVPALDRLRATKVAIAFQDPTSALDPLMTVGDQIAEALVHVGVSRDVAFKRAVSAMEDMRIPAAKQRARAYPHQLSGGMRQRVMVAMALVREPELLIVDEPTTALDVITQQEVLELIRGPLAKRGIGVLIITHDLSVVAQTCDRVVVMYAGKVVEQARTNALLTASRHPYSRGLIASIPALVGRNERLAGIRGSVPQPLQVPSGCRFHPRCPFAMERCIVEVPPDFAVGPDHLAACWLEAADTGTRVDLAAWKA